MTNLDVSNISDIIKAMLDKRLININQYNMARTIADTTNVRIEEVILEKGFIREKQLYDIFSNLYPENYGNILPHEVKDFIEPVKSRFDKINISKKDFSSVLYKFKDDIWEKLVSNEKNRSNLKKLGFELENKTFILTNEPFNINVDNKLNKMKSMRNTTKLKIFFLPSKEYKSFIQNSDIKLRKIMQMVVDINKLDIEEAVEQNLLSNFIDLTMEYCIETGASDIHIEPDNLTTNIRVRKDGVLNFFASLRIDYNESVFNLINGKTKDNNVDSMRPLDGQFNVEHPVLGNVNMRWGENRTIHGHHIVIRILNNDVQGLTLDNINYTERNLKIIRRVLKEPNGIVLITGPTGSGKTNTLAAILKEISKPETKILSLEDPVEIKLPIIQQVQVQPKAKLTVKAGLKSFLRQDPDIMFIGEIRDEEMAGHAIEGAMTGHLMLATLHTNDSLSSIIRMKDLDVEVGHIANTLKMVIAQRLIRRLCPHCKIKLSSEEIQKNHLCKNYGIGVNEENIYFHKEDGCEKCGFTGYSGRMPIAEIFVIDKFVQGLILKNIPLNEVLDKIKDNGFSDLQDSAIEFVSKGETDLDEVLRVLGFNNESTFKYDDEE